MENKKIKISCTGFGLVSIDDIEPIQGELKSLSDENFEKLKNQILEDGFSAPFFLWKDSGKEKSSIVDGTQRFRVLIQLREEGYVIPKLPFVEIHAANEKEARKKILSFISTFGKVDPQGLYKFLMESELSVDTLEGYDLPEINLDDFKESFYNIKSSLNPTAEWQGMPEFIQEDKTAHRSIVVHFANDEYVKEFAKLVKQNITDKTRYLWYPNIVIDRLADKLYVGKNES